MRKEIKSFFKVAIKWVNWKPSITEVNYAWADWRTYTGLQFEGYASTKDVDRTNDVVLPTAFDNCIKQYMENPIIFLQHDADKPIGSIIEASIDDNGLYIKGIVKSDKENIFQDLRTWVIKTMSFGYRVLDYNVVTKKDPDGNTIQVNEIKELELFEISLVSVPMNPKAQIKSKEELKDMTDEEYVKFFQINKKDEYTLFKSISDAMLKYKDIIIEDKKEEVVDAQVEETPVMEVETTDMPTDQIQEVVNEVTTEEEAEEVKEEAEDEEVKEEIKEEEVKEEIIEKPEEIIEEEKELESNWVEEKPEEVATEEVVEETIEETIETTNIDMPENVAWESDIIEETTAEAPENEVTDEETPNEVIEKVEEIEKSLLEIKEKSITTSEAQEKSISEISESLKWMASKEDVVSLSKSVSDLLEENKKLNSDNKDMQKALVDLAEITDKLYKAFQRITLDWAFSYKEEKQLKSNPVMETTLAKKLQAIKH